ncbi:MAG: DegT/DnrJ/EryC1/StrS family aminotransferase [Deltaproteobacteria bacterium]
MIPFGDLRREYEELSGEIDEAIRTVCRNGWFVLGKKLEEFEAAFADYIGDDVHALGVGSGTEAIHLALLAAGVGNGDYVITVPNTAVPTVSAISLAGAVPLLVDIDPHSYTMDPTLLRALAKKEKKRLGHRLKAIVPVHLYGQSAPMDPITEIAQEFDLTVIEDACQAAGALYRGRKVGSLGDYAAFSFYPSKNLGAYGDGGMVLTKDPDGAHKLRMLRNYGQEKRYHHTIKGINSRLDELQAAVLLVKLKYLDRWNARRQAIARLYSENIAADQVQKPTEMRYGTHIFHLYVIRHPRRGALQTYLEQKGVQTLIHYPIPIHLQEAYRELGYTRGAFPAAEECADRVLSLPMFPQLTNEQAVRVAAAIDNFDSPSEVDGLST